VNSTKRLLFKSAFTLLELLVAMAVMAAMLVLLLNVVDSATKLWREAEGRMDSYREARAALGAMSRDLANLVPTSTAGHFLVNSNAVPLLTQSAAPDTKAAIFFLSALPSSAQDAASNRSGVCQVGYFLSYGKSSGTLSAPVNSMNIYRYLLSSDPTFARLTNLSASSFPDDLATTGDVRVELIARNITGLAFRPFTAAGSLLTPFTPSAATPLPDLVEISLSAISQDAAKKLPNQAGAWSASASGAVRSAEQTFNTRIKIHRER
jgi:prepilin-type N-terminal cleavage/methylation domain-containing protein